MRNSFTAVIEQSNTYTEGFVTEPFEAAWATEARWFVRVLELSGEAAALQIEPEISPDGLVWCAEGSTSLEIDAEGLHSFPLREFGGWLRLNVRMRGEQPKSKVLIYLSLKE
jgi:hypothetical protein